MEDSLDRSITRVVAVYAVLQVAVFAIFGLGSGCWSRYWIAFVLTCLPFHLFLWGMLHVTKSEFALAYTGERLAKVNLANKITLLRISSLPTLLYLVIASHDFQIKLPLLIMVVVVFATDFIDGWVSRKTGQVTRIGKMMDSTSDYTVLVALTIVFFSFHLISAWFFALVVGRLGIQAVFMAIVFLARGTVRPRTTIMGKVAIASIMVLYAAQILELVVPVQGIRTLEYVEWAAAAIVAVSVVDKVIAFGQDLRGYDPELAKVRGIPGG